jgi:DNA-binding transcriptional regulator YiaG
MFLQVNAYVILEFPAFGNGVPWWVFNSGASERRSVAVCRNCKRVMMNDIGRVVRSSLLHVIRAAREAAMAGTNLHQKFARAYLFAEVHTIAKEAKWTPNKFAKVMGKSGNTIRAWLERDRLPDLGNLSLICDRGEVAEARKKFILHVGEQLLTGSELISNLEQRNMFVVESAERTYGALVKWDPVLMSALVQIEAFHNLLPLSPTEDPANKVKNWKRKERRQESFFSRIGTSSAPTAEIYIPSGIFGVVDELAPKDRTAQIDRLLEVGSMPGCEVRVVRSPLAVPFPFEAFEAAGQSAAGPDFVYVETFDQSRHVVEPLNLAVYDQGRSLLRADSQGIEGFLNGGVHRLAEEHPE